MDTASEIRLIQLLQEEVRCARALLDSLRCERSALDSLDDQVIALNSANKKRLIDSLQSASQARTKFIAGLGGPNVVNGSGQISSSDHGLELDMLFIELAELAQNCFDENRLVGQLINRRTQVITNAIACLSPHNDEQCVVYKENGQLGS
ncbi:MAG: flagellar protein FlgN [Pseudomonadales bacterium]|nr:flagellar protein FlgN [Pseudomonadales bacterium]